MVDGNTMTTVPALSVYWMKSVFVVRKKAGRIKMRTMVRSLIIMFITPFAVFLPIHVTLPELVC